MMRWTRLRTAWDEALVVGAEHGDGVFDFGEHIAEAHHETRQDALHIGQGDCMKESSLNVL